MTDGQVRALSDGNSIPLLGLGVWQVPDGTRTVNAVRWALELGYRHLDTAQAYGNEDGVGRGLRESGVPREDVFITTKFNPNRSDPARELEGSLKRLGVDQVDLYLVHWPLGGPLRAWPGMEKAKERGLARSIGVSNYSAAQLEQVVESGTVPPVVDQVQFSAMEYRRGLLAAAERRDIVLESYSSLGTGRHLRRSPGGGHRRPGEPDPGAGAAPLVRAAWRPGHPQVDAPGADRGERGPLQLHPVRRGHDRPQRPRHHGRYRPGQREHLVVKIPVSSPRQPVSSF